MMKVYFFFLLNIITLKSGLVTGDDCEIEEDCETSLGMESGAITDSQITASSQWDSNHAAIQARLNFKAGGSKQGGWSALSNDQNQWLQVDLGHETTIAAIATQGRNAHDQWVTSYKLQYGIDGVSFQYYMEKGENAQKVFSGNSDRDAVVYQHLSRPITARYIRIRPQSWYGHISLRMELYGCSACIAPIGMESGGIPDAQITASSEWDVNHAAFQARLQFQAGAGKAGSWSAKTNDVTQWLQVDIGSETEVKRVATQGRNGYAQWVTSYKLQFGNDGTSFQYYREQGDNADTIFRGNVDSDSVVYHSLIQPIKARYIRLFPVTWHGHVSLRMELYSCPAP